MDALGDLGPVLPPRAVVWDRAKQIEQLAARAKMLATPGPRADLGQAMKQFDHIRALLGEEGGDHG